MEETIELSNPTPAEILSLRKDLDQGEQREESVRTLLAWFGFQRRGVWVSEQIRSMLQANGITTEPDFNSGWIDSRISFKLAQDSEESATGSEPKDDPICKIKSGAFVPKIGMLKSANKLPVSVCRDDQIEKAVSLMLMNDYSQLPVLQGGRKVDGIISWKTIGGYYSKHSKQALVVRDCIESFVEVVEYETPLFEVTKKVIDNEYVLVRSKDQLIKGIVTTSDVSDQFRELSEAFLLVGEIENAVRQLLSGKFRLSEIQKAINTEDAERLVTSLTDLTFGEYVRIFQNHDSWEKLKLSLDRESFCERLDTVRKIRNEIMQFRPDGISPEDIQTLADTARFLRLIVH